MEAKPQEPALLQAGDIHDEHVVHTPDQVLPRSEAVDG